MPLSYAAILGGMITIQKKVHESKIEGLENSKILMIQRGEHAEHFSLQFYFRTRRYFSYFNE